MTTMEEYKNLVECIEEFEKESEESLSKIFNDVKDIITSGKKMYSEEETKGAN